MAKQENSPDKKDSAQESPFPDEITEKLNAKFRLKHVEWVVVHAYDFKFGDSLKVKVFAQPYIKKESAEMRADQVLGHNNWKNNFALPDDAGRFIFEIKVRKPGEDEWIPRRSAGSIDQNAKGGFASDAFEISESFAEKRTWAKIGIGRYLKRVPKTQVQVSSDYKEGWNFHSFKSNVANGKKIKIYWKPPQLPEWALHPEDSYDDNNKGEDPSMPQQKDTGSGSKKEGKMPAGQAQWDVIDSYYTNIPDDEKDKWDEYLYKDEIEDGEVVGKTRRKISSAMAKKIISSMQDGYGKLNDEGVPEDIAEIKNLRTAGEDEKK